MRYIIILILVIGIGGINNAQRLTVPTLSPYTKIDQQIGLTSISLEYSRPSAKGRTVFGDLVPYEKLWRTGANASTKLSFTESIKIGGTEIDSGTYAIYTIPGEKIWTIIIHGNTRHRSIAGDAYKESEDIFRFKVKAENRDDHTETFTMQFADLTTNSCNIRLSWENTSVKIPIEVDVDSHIDAQMIEFLKEPEKIPHSTYFRAAEYYLHNSKDLNKALDWINSALVKSKNNFRYGLLKAKILAKDGKKSEALVAIKVANEWANTANNANYIEQTSIFMESLEKKN